MLQQFSWGHFLIASIVFSLLWYGFVVLVFYRKELVGFLGFLGGGVRGAEGSSGIGKRRLVKEDLNSSKGLDDVEDESLMGASRLPDGVALLSSSDVGFSGVGVGLDPVDRYEQVGLVADVVEELKLIFSSIEKNAGDKRDFFLMLEKLKENYGRIGGHPSISSINSFIRLHAPFHLSEKELEDLWF